MVVEGLVAIGTAQLKQHRVALMAVDSICPIGQGSCADKHQVGASDAARRSHVVDNGVVSVAVGGAEGDAVEARGQWPDVQCAGVCGAVQPLGCHRPVVAVALHAVVGAEGKQPVEFFLAAHPLRGGVFLHEGVKSAQGVGLAQLVQLHAHFARKGMVVEVVVGKAQLGQVVADQLTVAVGLAHVEGQACKLHLAVGVGHMNGGLIDKGGLAPFLVLCLGGLAEVFHPWRKAELEAAVRSHPQAVVGGILLAQVGGLQP